MCSIRQSIILFDNLDLQSLEASAQASTSSPPTLNSRAAIIMEKSTGTILFAKNENEKFHIEICFKDEKEEFKLIAKYNLTKEETTKIFIYLIRVCFTFI